jgi:hypothetical protein
VLWRGLANRTAKPVDIADRLDDALDATDGDRGLALNLAPLLQALLGPSSRRLRINLQEDAAASSVTNKFEKDLFHFGKRFGAGQRRMMPRSAQISGCASGAFAFNP